MCQQSIRILFITRTLHTTSGWFCGLATTVGPLSQALCIVSTAESGIGAPSIDMTVTKSSLHCGKEGGVEGCRKHGNRFSHGLIRAVSEGVISYSDSEEARTCVSEASGGEGEDGDADSHPRSSEGAYHLLLKLARQERPVPFGHVFTKERRENVVNVGVGAYSEVFTFKNEKTVVKLIPIEGAFSNFHGGEQVRACDVLPEVIAMQALSQLGTRPPFASLSSCSSSTQNFVHLQRVSVVQGLFPSYLLAACKRLRPVNKSAKVMTNVFPKTQKWMALESDYGGDGIADKLPSCLQARLSIFCQIAVALAVAERRLRFEHRDLHCGNVLISCVEGMRDCENEAPSSTLDGVVYRPCGGPVVSIIDFTFSRLDHNLAPLFSDMSRVCERARVRKHPIDIVYVQMQEELGNRWGQFRPRTNCLCLNMIALWLWKADKDRSCELHSDAEAQLKWSIILHLLTNSQSAVDFVHKAEFSASFLFR
ncbi:Serine/threonine-protein kinase haspin [Taenia crassiceps]|uniref:Serine/threonine-protein kinase haspin n=1 Tax=Taenia crassiceps TaxID=6207 RepID=A0ABR4QRA7_9CEST